MRDLLTGLAILLLLCLTGALIAPHVIDWDSRRAQISEFLTEAAGHPVTVSGPIRITLLPTPGLKLSHVTFSDPKGLSGDVARLKLSVAIPPLLRGEVRMNSGSLDGARLVLRSHVADQAKPITATSPGGVSQFNLQGVSIQDLAIRNSSLTVLGAEGQTFLAVTEADGQLEATSLAGPFRGNLSFTAEGQRRSLRFSTGVVESAGTRLKTLLENESAAVRSEFDGTVKVADGLVSGDGKLTASGNAEFPGSVGAGQMIWRIAAKAKGSSRQATFDDIEVTLGSGERQAVFSGNGDLDMTNETPLRVTLATRQLDLDRLMSDENASWPRTPQALLAMMSGAGGTPADRPSAQPLLTQGARPSAELDLTIGAVLLGKDVISGARAIVAARDGKMVLRQASGEFPGRTALTITSDSSAPDPVATGDIVAESRDVAKFLGWYQGVPARPVGIRTLRMEGRLQQMQDGFSVSNASMALDEMKLSGSVALQDGKTGDGKTNDGKTRPKLTLRLTADQLDVAKLPEIADLDGGDAALDLDIAVDAGRVRFAGLGAGRIEMKLRRTDATLSLDQLAITDLGGASLAASGELGPDRSSLKADLDARDLKVLLALAERVSDHPTLPFLAARAKALSPARLSVLLEPDRPGTRGGNLRVSIKGALNDTSINGWLRLDQNGGLLSGEALDLDLRTASAAALFRQIGLESIAIKGSGGTALRLKGGGLAENETSVAWTLKGEMAGTALDIDARRVNDAAQPLAGTITMSTADLSPLAQSLLIAVPAVQPGQPLNLKAGFDLRGYKITLREMDMALGTGRVRGEIAFNLAEFGRVAGQLKTGPLDVASIAPLIFGEGNQSGGGRLWTAQAFGAPAPITLPGDLWIEAERVHLADGLSIEKPSFVLRFESGLIYLENASGDWGGGKLKGNATLRRADKSVSVTGRFGLKDMLLEQGITAQAFQGRASTEMDFSAIGDSPLGLVSGLSGTGRLELRQAQVKGLQAGALGAVVNAPPGEFALVQPETLASSLTDRLPGSLALPSGTMPVALSAGVLRAGPLSVASAGEEIVGSLGFDLKTMSLSAQAAIRLRDAPKGWTGPLPRTTLTWQGPVAAPQLKVDAAALANGMTALAIARETERIEALEQDQRERAAFNRRLQASQQEQRRLEEEKRRLEAVQRASEERRRFEKVQQEADKLEILRQETLKQEIIRQNTLRLRNTETLRLPPGVAAPPLQGNPPLLITPPAAR